MARVCTEEEIYTKVVDILKKEYKLDEDEIFKDSNISDDLRLDSLDIVEFEMVLEEHFNIEFETPPNEVIKKPERAEGFEITTTDTVMGVVKKIQKKLK